MSTASAPTQPTRCPSVLARHPLVSYLPITYVFSWLMFQVDFTNFGG